MTGINSGDNVVVEVLADVDVNVVVERVVVDSGVVVVSIVETLVAIVAISSGDNVVPKITFLLSSEVDSTISIDLAEVTFGKFNGRVTGSSISVVDSGTTDVEVMLEIALMRMVLVVDSGTADFEVTVETILVRIDLVVDSGTADFEVTVETVLVRMDSLLMLSVAPSRISFSFLDSKLSKASSTGLFVTVAASFTNKDSVVVSAGSVSILSLTSNCCCIGASVAKVENSLTES